MSTHSKLSPSAAHRWIMCPGSIKFIDEGDRTSSPAAIDGTHTHTLLEKSLGTGLYDSSVFIGETLKDEDGEFTVDKERADRAQVALDYIREAVQKLITPDDLPTVLSEKKVDAGKWFGRSDIKGTADVIIKTKNTLEVIDYKDGMGFVDVVNNPQLMLYALGSLEPGELEPKTVKMTIIQPKMIIKGGKAVTSHVVKIDDLFAFASKVKTAAILSDKDDAPLNAGDWCKWCKNKACTARAGQALKESGIMFDKIDLVSKVAEKEPTEMTDEQIQQILEAAPLLKQMIEAAEEEALNRFQSGKTIPGFKVVHGRGSRVWSFDEPEVVEKLKKMGIPKSHIYVQKVVSPAQVKKLSWEKKDGSVKQLSDKQLGRIEREFITKKEGKLTVVPEDDRREAVVLDASPMFQSTKQEDGLPVWLS